MLKLIFCIRRKAELSREEFQRIWRREHGELALSLAGATGMVRYIQSRTIRSLDDADAPSAEARELEAEYDGVSECWWESAEAFAAAMATPEAQEAARRLRADEERFIDHRRSAMFWVEEDEILPLKIV